MYKWSTTSETPRENKKNHPMLKYWADTTINAINAQNILISLPESEFNIFEDTEEEENA